MTYEIEQISTSDLTPYARNARTHSAEQVEQIVNSIKEFGFNNPVLIDNDNGIIAGHGRVMAADNLGFKDVPCIRLKHLSDEQRRAYVLADNAIALNAGWNPELLSSELNELQNLDIDLSLLGFNADDLNSFLNFGKETEYEAPEEFKEYDETIETEHQCPKCNYRWS